jgi:hypothetical protein
VEQAQLFQIQKAALDDGWFAAENPENYASETA